MNIRIILAAAALSMGCGAFADVTKPKGNQLPPTSITFYSFLIVESCVPGGNCTVNNPPGIAPITVQLQPDPNSMYHSTGHYITLDATTPVRYIGIVTIDAWGFTPGGPPASGQPQPSPVPPSTSPTATMYTFTVEILDDTGVVAKMNFSSSSPDNIASATLMSPDRKVAGVTLTAMMSIGPAGVMQNPQPNQVQPKWSLERGFLQ